ncbi:MAG: hypothetical protein AW09_000826 [Candidatus Accumulibacter phosphatis]|uniref:Uncharacterized protein n=1 Tax=Candidatus Accumulibacter phosphatis TaxID=327160 RepID=A0A080LYP9_9PROT|nr:MAG: hypothetical protein AW09_000826 [Candidatus Accumulibacter phosphatis]HCZ13490.1 hypothetical protein [Accumulibacter sp.]
MNPLRRLDQPGPDTRQAVRDVLFFMSDAFLAIATADTIPSESAARGVARILSVCADALHESAEGES